jgi:hypothetical protein
MYEWLVLPDCEVLLPAVGEAAARLRGGGLTPSTLHQPPVTSTHLLVPCRRWGLIYLVER